MIWFDRKIITPEPDGLEESKRIVRETMDDYAKHMAETERERAFIVRIQALEDRIEQVVERADRHFTQINAIEARHDIVAKLSNDRDEMVQDLDVLGLAQEDKIAGLESRSDTAFNAHRALAVEVQELQAYLAPIRSEPVERTLEGVMGVPYPKPDPYHPSQWREREAVRAREALGDPRECVKVPVENTLNVAVTPEGLKRTPPVVVDREVVQFLDKIQISRDHPRWDELFGQYKGALESFLIIRANDRREKS